MLISPDYKAQNVAYHAECKAFGGKAEKRLKEALSLIREYRPATVLDYGCGKGGLVKALKGQIKVWGYDPCVEEFSSLPEPADLLICYEGPEHYEEEFIDDTFSYMASLTNHVAWITMALRESKDILPDGRNAHITVHDSAWWLEKMKPHFKRIEVYALTENDVLSVLCFTR